MILDATTKSFEVVMAEAMTTTNPSYITAYTDVTTTTMTPISSDGTLNGVTPVTVISSPAASTQRKIQSIYISNVDTVSHVITVNYNDNATLRQIIVFTLQPGEMMTYVDELGWQVYSDSGTLKGQGVSIVGSRFMTPPGMVVSATNILVQPSSTNCLVTYLGTAAFASSSIDIQYRIPNAASGVTYAEIALYKSPIYSLTPQNVRSANLAAASNAQILTRLGYTDTSAVWTSPGLYKTNISLSPSIAPGDELYIAVSTSASGTPTFRGALGDDLSIGSVLLTNTIQPSTTLNSVFLPLGVSQAQIWYAAYLN